MGMREKLIELVNDVLSYLPWGQISSHTAKEVADHLIANGVTIPLRCNKCRYYSEDGEYCGMWGERRHPEHFCDEGLIDFDYNAEVE
jgi:hypothetical protein